MGSLKLSSELDFYKRNKSRFVKNFTNKFLVVKNDKLLGAYETEQEAYQAGISEYGNEPFLIKKAQKDEPLSISTANLINASL